MNDSLQRAFGSDETWVVDCGQAHIAGWKENEEEEDEDEEKNKKKRSFVLQTLFLFGVALLFRKQLEQKQLDRKRGALLVGYRRKT